MKKLTLVVPIYGVEKYIHRFLNSLEPNLVPGVECLLVDDGSKDNCGAIIDEFASMNKEFVRVIHKENGGLSSARNRGLKEASGEYIVFPDPDDYLSPNYVYKIFETIEKYNQPDMIFFDYYDRIKDTLKLKTVSLFKEGYIPKEIFLREFAKDRDILSMVWCKAIKKSFYNNFSFDENVRVAEDALLLTDLVLNLNDIVYVPEPLYYYVFRDDSLTKSCNVDDAVKFFEIAKKRYTKYNELFGNISIYMPVNACYGLLKLLYVNRCNANVKYYENFIEDNIKTIFFSRDFSLNKKKQCLFVLIGVAKYYNRLKYGVWKKG